MQYHVVVYKWCGWCTDSIHESVEAAVEASQGSFWWAQLHLKEALRKRETQAIALILPVKRWRV